MNRISRRRELHLAYVTLLFTGCGHAIAGPCESIATLALTHTRITTAQVVPAGGFVPAKPFFIALGPLPYAALPAFCRVAGHISPVKDSDIAFEVWLPVSDWNGKLVAIGNGGYSGEIWFPFMAAPLGAGYVAAGTDTGHEGTVDDASFALGHPEKVIDFGHRAVHELAVRAKAITIAFYGRSPKHAFWNGCSTGGRQGLAEAQRYPEDFDGVIAGAPANYVTRLGVKSIVVSQGILKDPANFIPPDKLVMLHQAVLAACDAQDGVKDDVIENPQRCNFDPASLRCSAADADNCLTSGQVTSAQSIYAPLLDPRTHEPLYPGLSLGSELAWSDDAGPMLPAPSPVRLGLFEYIVFKKKSWDYRTFNLVRDLPIVEEVAGPTLDAVDANLTPFFERGGKLLQYHGWSDHRIPPLNSVDYYDNVRAAVDDPELDRKYRLFMVPGMGHCAGGTGPDKFDALKALDAWVETGKPPESIIATRLKDGVADRTRPLCPYPKAALYRGTGSPDDAASFVCAAQ
jgi:feruloyl esterase